MNPGKNVLGPIGTTHRPPPGQSLSRSVIISPEFTCRSLPPSLSSYFPLFLFATIQILYRSLSFWANIDGGFLDKDRTQVSCGAAAC